jgi:membrane associated rhomboid family serine protease
MPTHMRWGSPPGGRFGGGGGGSYNILGQFVAKPIAWLIAATIGATALGAMLQRNGVPIITYMLLVPDWVMRGEAWRVLTWVLLEPDPLGLVFGCLLLFFIGPELLYRWGTRRFFLLYFGTGAIVGGLTCVIGRFLWPDLYNVRYFTGVWPIQEALIIAWATLYPDRPIRVFFVLPLAGRHLVAFTIAVTAVYALINGVPNFVPHFLAELLALVYMDVLSVRRAYLHARMAMLQRDYRRRTANLKVVDRETRRPEEPPRWTH